MKFDRNQQHQLIAYYEYFFMKNDWTLNGIPFGVGDWYLLVGWGPSAIEYPLEYAAIYIDETKDDDPAFIYVEVTEDKVMKFVVERSIEALRREVPERTLDAVNTISHVSTS